jgi:hypothetical protein
MPWSGRVLYTGKRKVLEGFERQVLIVHAERNTSEVKDVCPCKRETYRTF